jgi:RNA polymerase sigma-70 factor, ECF subfamily
MSVQMPTAQPAKGDARPSHLRLVTAEIAEPAMAPVSPPAQGIVTEADQWWLEALRRNDSAALTRLYREHHEPVRALVRRLVSQSADVEDVVHEVFVAAPAAFKNYRGEGSVRSYLFSVAVFHVRRHLRATTRRRSWLERLHLVRVPDAQALPDTNSERRQLADRLRAALDTLSFDHRAAVVLCEIEELSSVEAAEVLGVPEATVRTRLHYAKKKLRAQLEEETS